MTTPSKTDVNHEQIQKSMEIIAEELEAIRLGAEHLTRIYREASMISDLTFIKILEEKYQDLVDELGRTIEGVTKSGR